MVFGRRKQAAESAGHKGRSKSLVVGGGNKRRLEAKTASAPVLSSSSKGSSRVKGILKFVSVAESLAAKYGAGDRGGDPTSANGEEEDGSPARKGINFHMIEIREYERTIGDNPSCSSGPPIA